MSSFSWSSWSPDCPWTESGGVRDTVSPPECRSWISNSPILADLVDPPLPTTIMLHPYHHHHQPSSPPSQSSSPPSCCTIIIISLSICNSPKESLRGRIGQITKVVWFQSLADECDQFKAVRPSGLVSNFVSCTICRIAELVPTPLSQCPALCPHHQHSRLFICSLETTPPPREQSERRGHSNEETLPVQQKVTDVTKKI